MNKVIKYNRKNLLNIELLLNKFKVYSRPRNNSFSITYFYKIQNNLIYYYQEVHEFYGTSEMKYSLFGTSNLDEIKSFWDLKNSLFF